MNKKIYLIILLIIASTILLDSKNIFAINTMNEGYQLGGAGSTIYINYPSFPGLAGKRVYRNSGTAAVFVPTKTDAEVSNFCAVSVNNVGATCADCGWGSWYNYDCQSSNIWQTRIDSSNCGSAYSTGGSCSYCSVPSTCVTYSAYSDCVIWINANNCAALPPCPSGYTCDTGGGCNSCGFLVAVCRAHCVASCKSNHTCP